MEPMKQRPNPSWGQICPDPTEPPAEFLPRSHQEGNLAHPLRSLPQGTRVSFTLCRVLDTQPSLTCFLTQMPNPCWLHPRATGGPRAKYSDFLSQGVVQAFTRELTSCTMAPATAPWDRPPGEGQLRPHRKACAPLTCLRLSDVHTSPCAGPESAGHFREAVCTSWYVPFWGIFV